MLNLALKHLKVSRCVIIVDSARVRVCVTVCLCLCVCVCVCLCVSVCPDSDGQNRLVNLPRFQILSKLENTPNLNNFDVERNTIEEVNFGYYTPQQFEEKTNGNESYYKNNFSVFHCNVRSMSASYDDL